MKKVARGVSCLAVSLILTACGGGGGGSAGSGTIPFTSVSAVRPSSTVVASAMSQEVDWAANPLTGTVTGIDPVSAVSTTSFFTVTVDATGAGTKWTLSTPTSTVTFDKAAGDTVLEVMPGVVGAINLAGTSAALMASSTYFGWDYQGYGVWETSSPSGSGTDGVMSWGAATPASSIPIAGNATFNGNAGGIYITSSGDSYLAAAALTVNANFSARTLAFSTTGTVITTDFSTFTPNPGLNLNGTLSYSAGTNSFSGSVTSSSGTLSGNSTGQFYGPTAQELGGVYYLTGSGLETYGGGYGAKR